MIHEVSRHARRGIRWALAGAGVALLAQSAGAQVGHDAESTDTWIANPPPPKRFIFDGAFQRSNGLQFRFSRPIQTLNPDATPVPADVPRYANSLSIAGATKIEQVRETAAPISVIASGMDHDGVTPLLVVYESRDTSYLDVFAAAGEAFVAAEHTGVGRVRTMVGSSGDLMGGTIPGKRYRVTSGVVCHGLVVIFCTVVAYNGQSWRDSANAFIVSQDRGHTWSLTYESEPFAEGVTRGASWSMQNWWPTARGVPPQEAYFTASDYCSNPGSPGGRFYIMRARRTAPGQPWTVEPAAPALSLSGVVGEHIHAGGVIPYGEHGIRAFIAVGDSRSRNRIVSLVNRQGDYLSGDWEVMNEYHGAAGDPGIDGNQFVGCAPGPWESSALVGADINAEQVMLLSMPEGSIHPQTLRLCGLPLSDMTGNNSFVIRTPTPELGGPYCASAEPFSTVVIPGTRRALYSPDGVRWMQAATPDRGYPMIHGPHFYFDGAPGNGLMRAEIPPFTTGRPLLIGSGGIQHCRSDPAFDIEPPARMFRLTRDSLGRWIDNGIPLDPQPPTLGSVFRITTTADDPSPLIARLFPAGRNNRINAVPGDHVQVRVWVMHQDDSRTAPVQIGIGESGHAPQFYRSTLIPSTGAWIPVIAARSVGQQADTTLMLQIRCSGERCPDQTMYLALDTVSEGRGLPGYSMPVDTSNPAVGAVNPDELARITGLGCLASWTVTLALQIPEDGFDFRSELQSQWTLATLWGDAQNFVEVYAESGGVNRIGLRLTTGGKLVRVMTVDTATILRGSPLLFSVAQPPGKAGMELTVAACGRNITTITLPVSPGSIPRLGVSPREIRFSSPTLAPSSSGRGDPVSPLLVWGGQINDRSALTRAEREQLLRTLSFLKSAP